MFVNTHGLLGTKTNIISHILCYKLDLVAYWQACFAPERILKRDRFKFFPNTQNFESICENSCFCEIKSVIFRKTTHFLFA